MTDYELLQHLVNELCLPAGRPNAHEALELNEVTKDIRAVVQAIRDDYGLDI